MTNEQVDVESVGKRSELATHSYDVDDRALVVSMQRDVVDTATGHDVRMSCNMAATVTMSRSMF